MSRSDRQRDLLLGVNPVLEQLRSEPTSIRRVLVVRGARGRALRVAERARAAGVPVVTEEGSRLRALAGAVVHQGVAAEVAPYRYALWPELLGRRPECILALDQVTDPRNLGALVRSADAAGVGGVILPEHRSAAVTPAAARAAAGATASMPIARVPNLVRALEELKEAGYWLVGLDAGASESLFGFRFPPLCAVVVGSEGKGLRRLVGETCDHRVAIPMAGRVGSLNVSVAAAVALFERVRQREKNGV